MVYTQLHPPDSIRQYIRYFWVLESDNDAFKILSPLADGCPGIIFQHAGAGSFFDRYNNVLPEVYLYGQTITPTQFYMKGNFKIFGVCFYPHALRSIFGFNAAELTDDCVDLTLLGGNLREQLINADSTQQVIELFSSYVVNRMERNHPRVDGETTYALTRLVQSKGNVPLKELQQKLQLSERALERKFNQHIGVSPKQFAKICQFQSAFVQLKEKNYTNLSDIAFDNGYSDQSHFIRTFKSFAGISPLQFQKNERRLGDNFSLV